jgi:hypothetical protein
MDLPENHDVSEKMQDGDPETVRARDKSRLARAGAWKLRLAPETPGSQTAPSVAVAPGDFTQMFQSPSAPAVTQSIPLPGVVPPPSSAAPAQTAVNASAGEFTSMFRAETAAGGRQEACTPAHEAEITRTFAPPSAAETLPFQPAAPELKPPASPGEFTSMFRAEAASGLQPAVSSSALEGEVTRTFRPPIAVQTFGPGPEKLPTVSPAPPESQLAQNPGEFTSMFQAGATAQEREITRGFQPLAAAQAFGARPAIPPAAPPASPEFQRSQTPGEFTRMFRAEPASAPPQGVSLPPAQARGPANQGEFTRMFRSPAAAASPAFSAPAAGQVPANLPSSSTGVFAEMTAPPAATLTGGPSEYTRMISVRHVEAPAAAAPSDGSASASSAPAKGLNVAVVVAILAGFVVLVLAIGLFFALKR